MRLSGISTAAPTRAIFGACWRPSVRGLTPTATYEITAMMSVASTPAFQLTPHSRTQTSATSTAAAISQVTRTSSTRLK
jgi:hypothetical protein